jgi:predicted metal-binding membrane protein
MSTGLMLETALRRDRWIVAGMLTAVFVLAWAYLLTEVGMDMGAMEGMPMSEMAGGAALAPAKWTFSYAVVMFFMWWIMMIAMMVPSAAQMILLFSALHRKKGIPGSPHIPTALFLTSYLVAWTGFSLVATALQWGLARSGLLIEKLVPARHWLSYATGVILTAWGGWFLLY